MSSRPSRKLGRSPASDAKSRKRIRIKSASASAARTSIRKRRLRRRSIAAAEIVEPISNISFLPPLVPAKAWEPPVDAAAAAEQPTSQPFTQVTGTFHGKKCIQETGDPDTEGEVKFLFCISRMNPPTPGHLLLIEEMIDIAKQENIPDIHIILSQTLDKNNPIKCDDATEISKRYVLDRMIEKVKRDSAFSGNINIICSQNPMFQIAATVQTKFSPETTVKIILVAGSDRCDNYLKAVPNMIKNTSQIKSYRLMVLPRTAAAAAPGDLSDRSAISGSRVRKLVAAADRADFNKLYGSYLPETDKGSLYDAIDLGMKNNKNAAKTKEGEVPPHCSGRVKFFMLNGGSMSAGSRTRRRR